MNIFKAAIVLVGVGMLLGSGTYSYAAQPGISLSSFRAVRVSTDSITLSFTTDSSARGKVEYIDIAGSTITLTDSAPQIDHLFTLDGLNPSHGYTFILTAESGEETSYRYSVLLAPELVGARGQSIVPPIDVLAADGTRVSSSLSASTTPYDAAEPPVWLFLLTAVGVAGAAGTYKYLNHRRAW